MSPQFCVFLCISVVLIVALIALSIVSGIEICKKCSVRKEKLKHLSDVFCEMQGIAKATEENIQKTEKCIESISKKVTDEMKNISETMCEKVTEIIKGEITEVGKGVIKDCDCCRCTCEEKTETTNGKTTSTIIKKCNCNCPSKIRADMFKAYANAIVDI